MKIVHSRENRIRNINYSAVVKQICSRRFQQNRNGLVHWYGVMPSSTEQLIVNS